MEVISKTAQVLKYFAQQYGAPPARSGIPRKRLVKMVYLADLLAREYLGHPLTDLNYYRYKYGPYDESIKGFIVELVSAGMAESTDRWEGEYHTKFLVDTGIPVSFDLSLGEMEILRYVARTYLRMPMEELLRDVVYPSRPMQQTTHNEEPLPMSDEDNRAAKIVGFDLEETLRAEAEIDAGQFKTSLV